MKRLISFVHSFATAVKLAVEFTFGWLTLLFYVAGSVFIFGACLKIFVEPLAPLITILFALAGTLYACTSKATGTLALLGLAIYAVAWPSTSAWGTNIGMAVCVVGFLTWIMAIYFAFDLRNPQPRPSTVTA